MSPVASRWAVPRKSVTSGWVRVTSQPALDWSSRSLWSSGSEAAIAWATSRSTTTGPQEVRSATCSSTQIAAALGNRWVWRATRRACQAGTSNRDTRFHRSGRRWRRSRASAMHCAPADGDMPERQRERFGGERRHQRGALAAERLIRQERGSAERLDPGVLSGGVEVCPVGGESNLRNAARRSICSASVAASSTPAGSRSPTSYSSRTVVLMGLSQAPTTDSRGRESPVSTGDSRIVTYL